MAVFLYNISIAFYGLAIRIASLFNEKASRFIKGRKRVIADWKTHFEKNQSPVVWFHVASLGEFEQAKPVMEAFKAKHPHHKLFITFFSPSGYEVRKNYEAADFISYLPLDTPSHARALMDIVNPSLVVFVKYEFWYHYLHEAAQRKIPLYSISALFTPRHVFFKWHGGLHKRMLSFFDQLFVQNEESLTLLRGIGIQQCAISGDTRFDRVVNTLATPEKYPIVEAFRSEERLMVIGSSWASDMRYLYPIINRDQPGLKFIIAPHEVHEASVQQLEKGLEVPSVRITRATAEDMQEARVLIVDTIGMLSNIYQYGSFAYIGGAFGDGLHNILEAVTFGLPVIFGNQGLEKFPESLELAKLGGAFVIGSAIETESVFKGLSEDEKFRKGASMVCKDYIAANTGATEKIMNYWEAHYEG